MMILQWFNPFIYLYKRDLQLIHEYAADHEVLHGGADKGKYMYLILQQCTAVNFSSMSNNFNLLFTQKKNQDDDK
jgi:beta-lactamase regulating signal transducer with metallopeptidase domain